MAQPTAQDLIDALDRLTKAFQTLYQLHPANSQTATPAAGATPPPAANAPTSPQQNQRRQQGRGQMGGRLSRLRQAYQAFKAGRSAFRAFGEARSLARQGRYGAAVRAGAKGLAGLGRGAGMAGRGASMAGGAGAAGAAGAAATGVGAAVAVVILLVDAFRKFKQHVEQTTEALIQAQQRLAEFSPSMAAVMARRQMLEIQRDAKKGEALSASAAELVSAEQRRKDAALPFEILQEKIQNWLYTQANDFLAGAMAQAAAFFGLDPEGQRQADLMEQIQKEADAEMRRKDAARKRMGELEQKAKVIGRKKG